jgi:lycopene elongase/hydratase (dihydrobisanhydrobacterioruberin-forming)
MLSKIVKAYRLYEAFLMTGFFVIGSFFGINDLSLHSILLLVYSGIISFLVILSIYSYNASAGKITDKYNTRLKGLSSVSKKTFNISGYLFTTIAILLSLSINIYIAIFCVIVNIIWVAYSQPKYGLKYKPYFGTILHFFAQIIQFNMCYHIFESIDIYSIALSIYFALAFSTGHLHHEIIDLQSDKLSGFQTTTIKHGVTTVVFSILIICTINVFFVTFLFLFNILDLISLMIMMFPIVFHILLYLVFYKQIVSKAIQIRNLYRIAYFTCFAIFIVYKIITLF